MVFITIDRCLIYAAKVLRSGLLLLRETDGAIGAMQVQWNTRVDARGTLGRVSRCVTLPKEDDNARHRLTRPTVGQEAPALTNPVVRASRAPSKYPATFSTPSRAGGRSPVPFICSMALRTPPSPAGQPPLKAQAPPRPVPGPPGLPWLGQLPTFLRTKFFPRQMLAWAEEYNGVYSFEIVGQRYFVVVGESIIPPPQVHGAPTPLGYHAGWVWGC